MVSDDLLAAAREVALEVRDGLIDPDTMIVVEQRATVDGTLFVEWHELPDPLDPSLVKVWSLPAGLLAQMAKKAESPQTVVA